MQDPDPKLPPPEPDPDPLGPPVPGPNPDEPGPDVLPQIDPLTPQPQRLSVSGSGVQDAVAHRCAQDAPAIDLS